MKITVLLVIGLFCSAIYAQHNNELYNAGSLIHIQAGADVHVWGDVHMLQASGDLENNGLLKVQGHMYSDNLFQQSGTGTTRIENNNVNIGERQKIQGSYAVRSVGSTNLGVNDGSFYNLELANDQGVVYLVDVYASPVGDYVADVRNDVDYWAGGVYNRIITHDVGVTGAMTIPANGSGYTSVFGVMNTAALMTNNTVALNGNMSGVDWGYTQGRLRRRISPAGGSYQYVLGVEPAGAGAQRGMQYTRLDFIANNYDVLEGYFESALDNSFPVSIECSGNTMDYFGGVDHGQWIFNDATGAGSGVYTMTVWPQDDNFIIASIWMITKDNGIAGTANQCGPSPVGLVRGGFDGFSTFDVAAALSLLPIELLDISATGIVDHIDVEWNVATEINLSHYELERSEDASSFEHIADITATGGPNNLQTYLYNDYDVRYHQNFYYRVKSVDLNGDYDYSPIVVASLDKMGSGFNENSVVLQPNPSFTDFNISIYSDEKRNLNINIFNSIGQIIERKEMIIHDGNTVVKVASEEWANGVYYIELRDIQSEETITKRFIKN